MLVSVSSGSNPVELNFYFPENKMLWSKLNEIHLISNIFE